MGFQYADLDTGEVIETDDPVTFWNWLRAKAEREVATWRDCRLAALTHRHALGEARDTVKQSEAAVSLSEQIDGKNAETRAAQLVELLSQDQHYAAAVEAVRNTEYSQSVAEADAEAAYARYRVALRDLEVMAALYSPQEQRADQQ